MLRTRTRNARTRAKANVIQACGLLQLAVACELCRIDAGCMYLRFSYFGLAYAYRNSLFSSQIYKCSDSKHL